MKEKSRKSRWIRPIIVIVIAAIILLIIIIMTVVISCAVYRYCRKKSKDQYGPVATKENEISLNTLKNKITNKQTQQPTADSYPEECATP
jgi:flagellar basal body-associated protein FliL